MAAQEGKSRMRWREVEKSGQRLGLDDPVPHAPGEANKPQAAPSGQAYSLCGDKRPKRGKRESRVNTFRL